MSTDRVTEIRGRLDAATEGPWAELDGRGQDQPGRILVSAENSERLVAECLWSRADAGLIANAPADLAALLAAVDAVLALHDGWEHDAPDPLVLLLVKRTREAVTEALGADR